MQGYEDMPLVEITWIDHSGDGGWEEKVDDKPIECRTVGWLKTGKVHLHVYDTLTSDGGRGGVSKILKTCVMKKRILWEQF